MQFFVIFLGLVLGGVYLDKRLSTGPWLTMVGTALGGTAAFATLYREVYGRGKNKPRPDGSPPDDPSRTSRDR